MDCGSSGSIVILQPLVVLHSQVTVGPLVPALINATRPRPNDWKW